MPRKPVSGRYTRVASMLHWGIAALIVAQIALGLSMDHGWVDDTLSFTFFQTHRALGVLTLVLVLVRVIWRLCHTPPAFDDTMTRSAQQLASCVHAMLYGLQVLAPFSGWAMASVSALALPIVLIGGIDFPLLPLSTDGRLEAPLRAVHHWVGWVFAALILLHATAALFHAFACKDRIFERINPFVRK